MPSAVEVYLDTNAVSYLLHPPPECPPAVETQRALKRHVEEGSLTVVTSLSVLGELSGLAGYEDKGLYQKTQALLWAVVGSHVLGDNYDRIQLELRQGPLSGADRFLPRAKRRHLRSEVRSLASARAVYRKVRQQKEQFATEFEKLRKQVLAELGDNPTANTRDWWKNTSKLFDDWTVAYFRNNRQLLALPVSEDDWPEPRQVPSAWHKHAFYLALINQKVGERRKIQPSDHDDVDHYVHASYVDLMVTNDGPFSETCDIIPDRPFQIETFQDFATTRLGAAS